MRNHDKVDGKNPLLSVFLICRCKTSFFIIKGCHKDWAQNREVQDVEALSSHVFWWTTYCIERFHGFVVRTQNTCQIKAKWLNGPGSYWVILLGAHDILHKIKCNKKYFLICIFFHINGSNILLYSSGKSGKTLFCQMSKVNSRLRGS